MASVALTVLKQLTNITSTLYGEKRLIVLIYHRVLDKPDPMRPGEIDVATFSWQMDLLSEYFNVLSLDDAIAKLNNGTLPPRAICITFDDGYADNHHNALPILLKRNLTACFFIATGYLNGGRMWNDTIIESFRNIDKSTLSEEILDFEHFDFTSTHYRAISAQEFIRDIKHMPITKKNAYVKYIESVSPELPNSLMLTDYQIKDLYNKGMIIGAHTVSHPILLNLNTTEIKQELYQSRSTLRQITGHPVDYFAYPNGRAGSDYLPKHTAIVKELGFSAAFTTHFGSITSKSDYMQLPRFRPWDENPTQFMMRLSYMYAIEP